MHAKKTAKSRIGSDDRIESLSKIENIYAFTSWQSYWNVSAIGYVSSKKQLITLLFFIDSINYDLCEFIYFLFLNHFSIKAENGKSAKGAEGRKQIILNKLP